MAKPGDLSSKKVKNTYKAIMQHDGATSKLYDGTGSMINSIDVTRITASNASLANIRDLQHLTVSRVQIDTHLSVSGSTFLGDDCGTDQVKVVGNTWVSGAVTVSGSCEGSFRSIGQAKFIYLDNPVIEDQKPARVTRGMVKGRYNVPRFGGENAALDVYGNVVITGSLIVQDTVFAQEFHSETVSQSIIYTSGSTKFGGDFADTMTVTGSIFQSGSDAYFLNGIGIGTTGSQKLGIPDFNEPGQDNAVEFTHLLRIDDAGHDGLQYKNGKMIYGTYGTKAHQKGLAHVSASDTVRYRDSAKSEDVLVISAISQSVFITNESDVYNVAIGAPSRSLKIDEKLVVSSSKDTRVKIESGTGAKSASLYLESGKGVWELSVASESIGANNHLSESLVFRTRNSRDIKNTFGANSTYTEALRLNNRGRAGFNIPSANLFDYPQQVQISGSLNIIQGRTVDINAGTFHDSDGINGLYFNNQKMLYVSGSGISTNQFFGFDAGNSGTATTAIANIGIGRRSLKALTTGDYNTGFGYDTGLGVTTGTGNILMGSQAGFALTDNDYNIAIGYRALLASANDGDLNIAIGYHSMNLGDVSGASNVAIGEKSLNNLTSGATNIAIGKDAAAALTTATNTIAIGNGAIATAVLTGANNIGIGHQAGGALTGGFENIFIGSNAGDSAVTSENNIAIGHQAFATAAADGDKNVAIGFEAMTAGIVSGTENIALGSNALDNLTSGTDNIAIGSNAGDGTTTAADTIAIGHDAMSGAVTTGDNNIAIGKLALKSMVGGTSNIGIGYRALRDTADTATRNIAIGNQVAFDGILTGADNIIMGTSAANLATSLAENVIIGSAAASEDVVTGNYNVILGPSTAQLLTSGESNIIIGQSAGSNSITTNTNNILIGTKVSSSAGLDNAHAIGSKATVNQADSLVLGSQTGKRFRTGIGGLTAPNAILEVSGTINVTGSAQFSGSATNGTGHEGHVLKTVGTTVMSGSLNSEHFLAMRALEVSGTSNFHGNTYITGNLFVSDIVVAQEFHTEFVSASITFTSGSHKMGDTNDDVHQMTGSLRVSGSEVNYFVGRLRRGATAVTEGGFAPGAKLGINTIGPTYELDVVGNIGVGSGSNDTAYTNAPAYIYNNDDTDTFLQFQDNRIGISAGSRAVVHFTGSAGATDPNRLHINPGHKNMDVQSRGASSGAGQSEPHLLFVSGGSLINENNITQVGSVGIRTSNPTKALTVSGSISASGDLYIQGDASFRHVTASGNISASGGSITGSHLFSSGYISASLDIQGRSAIFGNASVHINGTAGHITASGNISASGYISASHVIATSGSYLNITVTGSGAAGSGSFGRVDAERVFIHNHELIGGSGLTVDGATTILGTAGQNNQPVVMYGNLTASNAWFSGSGGHISASSMTLANNLTILGNISGSYISASQTLYSYNNIEAGSHITASGNISASGYIIANNITASNNISASGEFIGASAFITHITASGNISSSGTIYANALQVPNLSGSFISSSKSIFTSGHITASGNISSSRAVIANNLFVGRESFAAQTSNTGNAGLYIVTQSLTGGAESASMIVLHNEATSDLYAQRSFIDFKFTDGNANVIPQVKIGAEVGNGDGNASDQVQEGMGAFVVYTTSASSATAGNNTEKFRVSHEGNVGIGTSNPIQALEVKGNVTASGNISSVGGLRASGSIASRNYRSFYIAAAGMTPAVTNGASTGTEERPGNASGDNVYPTVDYLAFDAGTNEAAHFQIVMPGEWDLGTIKVRYYFMTDTADGGSNNQIVWQFSAEAISDAESMNNQFNNLSSTFVTAHDDDEKLVVSDASTAITVQNTPVPLDLINFRVARKADDLNDTYTGDAHLLGISIQYQERVVAEAAW